MPIKVQCPGCSDRVVAEESDRGKTIKCGTCWTPVTIPAAEGAPKPATPLKTAILLPNPPAKSATATALPLPPAAAKVVPAAAVVPAPVVAVPVAPGPKPSDKKKKDKPRFKSRDLDDDGDDEDDDYDTPRKGQKKGNAGLLVGLGALALVLVIGCGGFGWWLMKPTADSAATTPTDGSGGGDPAKPKNWRPIAGGDGFSMDTPDGDATKTDAKVSTGQQTLDAKKYVKKDADSTIQVAAVHCDLKGDALRRFDAPEMMSAMFVMPRLISKGSRYIGDREVQEFVLERGVNHDFLWVGRVADRAYGFHFHWENPEPAGAADLKEAFFRSLNVSYVGVEPFEPQPWNPGGNPGNPNPRPDPARPIPIEQPWVALENKSGISVDVPKGIQTEKVYFDINSKSYSGRKYWVEDAQCQYAIYYHDVPDETGVTSTQILTPLLPFPHGLNTTADVKVDGKAATKFTLRHFHGGPGYAQSVRSGYRVFTFLCTSKQGLHMKPDPTHEERADKFFKSIKLAFDPKKNDPLADEPAWAAMAKTVGFTAIAPKGTNVADHSVGFARDTVAGKEYKSEDEAMAFLVYTYDLPPGGSIDKIVTEHIARNKISDGPKPITIDGYGAEELTFLDVFKLPYVIRSVKVGNRAIVLKVSKRFGGGKVSDMEYEAKKAKFFGGFHIGNGPPPENPGGEPMPNPGATGEFVKAGKVLQFWTAVVLPEKKELVTLSVRDGAGAKPGGTIRRYGYPDFKLKATYQIPLPVNRAVVDEKAGRLYCATVSVYDRTFSERELSFAQGDIQVFDLNKLLDGKLAELEDVKPLATIPIGTRISGLEISSKEPVLYVSAITTGKDKGKTFWKGRLYKIEADKQKVLEPIDLADPVWSMRLSPDGDKLYAGEMPLTPGGQPLLGVARPTNVVVVDAATWKRTKALPLPGAPVEIALAGERVLAIVSSKAEPNLLALDSVGEVVDVTPRADAMTGTRYLRTTADGKTLILSGGIGVNTVSLFDVTPGNPPKLSRVAGGNAIDAQPLGGHFIISPDGRYAIFNTGIILDIEKSAGKK